MSTLITESVGLKQFNREGKATQSLCTLCHCNALNLYVTVLKLVPKYTVFRENNQVVKFPTFENEVTFLRPLKICVKSHVRFHGLHSAQTVGHDGTVIFVQLFLKLKRYRFRFNFTSF